jgi:hypothetical protein
LRPEPRGTEGTFAEEDVEEAVEEEETEDLEVDFPAAAMVAVEEGEKEEGRA